MNFFMNPLAVALCSRAMYYAYYFITYHKLIKRRFIFLLGYTIILLISFINLLGITQLCFISQTLSSQQLFNIIYAVGLSVVSTVCTLVDFVELHIAFIKKRNMPAAPWIFRWLEEHE